MITFVFGLFFRKIFTRKSLLAKLIFEIISLTLTVAVIFYASESFELKTGLENREKLSLFVFLLVGEIALIFPMSFSERLLAHFLEIRHQQFYFTLVGLKISPTRFVFGKALADSIFPLVRVMVILGICTLFLGLQLSFLNLLIFFGLQILATCLFSIMALITCLCYLKFNRGVGLFHTLQSFAAIIGGVYFPNQIFPSSIKNFSDMLPQTQILHASRLVFSDQSVSSKSYLVILSWILLLAGIWSILNRFIISWQKQHARFP
ncbi:MAG TPA: ABC transporter permease [Bacteriovoracaceae bacterium]|nr:ABC transporter permease [Bacteriovoracaceae bacterium]